MIAKLVFVHRMMNIREMDRYQHYIISHFSKYFYDPLLHRKPSHGNPEDLPEDILSHFSRHEQIQTPLQLACKIS